MFSGNKLSHQRNIQNIVCCRGLIALMKIEAILIKIGPLNSPAYCSQNSPTYGKNKPLNATVLFTEAPEVYRSKAF